MGFGQLLVATGEAYQIIKNVVEIIKLLGIDQEDAEKAMKTLKEFCEGTLVDVLEDVVEKLTKACKELIANFTELFENMDKDIKEIEKTDKDSAELLKSALNM